MTGTKEGGEKTARTRGHEEMARMGHEGGKALASDPKKKSEASKKAVETRGGSEAMSAMGREGGKHSHGGKSEKDER